MLLGAWRLALSGSSTGGHFVSRRNRTGPEQTRDLIYGMRALAPHCEYHKAQSCNKQSSLSQWIHPTRTEHVLFSIDELAATTICRGLARDCFCI